MEVSTIQNTKNKRTQNVVSALTARTQLGQILRRAAESDERFVVDYIRNIAPTPAAYQAIRKEAKRNGGSSLTMGEINAEIAVYRRQRSRKNGNHPAA